MAEAQSPKEPSAQSQKRPLDEPSSPSGPADAPDAKRPALDKAIDTTAQPQESEQSFTTQTSDALATSATELSEAPAAATAESNGKAGDHSQEKPAVEELSPAANPEALDTQQPATPATTSNGTHDSHREAPHHHHHHNNPPPSHHTTQDETSWLHLRAIISSAEAATVIGKGGENVSQIRRLAGAKCTVSEYTRGAVERILTVSGPVDAVAKAFGLIIRTLNQEPLDQASTPQSKTYPLRLLIPHILIGSIIGKAGVRIREIQEASGARLNASESCLPLSTERSLVVLGVADAIHIAAYYVGSTLVEQLTERFGGPAASAYASRHGSSQGAMPGGMQVAPYVPMPAGGQIGHPDYRKQMPLPNRAQQPHAYGMPYMPQGPTAPSPYGAGSPRAQYAAAGPQQPYGHMQQPQQPVYGQPAQPMHAPPQTGQAITQQIYIPNDMVGAIIGKGGAKINEIRQLSGSVIKINEPQDNSNERLVTVTGTQECNQMALYMLYQRLGESSKNSNSMMPR